MRRHSLGTWVPCRHCRTAPIHVSLVLFFVLGLYSLIEARWHARNAVVDIGVGCCAGRGVPRARGYAMHHVSDHSVL